MVWLQNLVVVVIGFLLYRLVIEEGLHLVFVDFLLREKEADTTQLVSSVLLLSYTFSLFFPNAVVVIALIPMVVTIVERIDEIKLKRKLTTTLALTLIYGANIGGMGSMIGASSNIVFLGYIEFMNVPGRENITFFSWFLFGIPITLVLLLMGKKILTFRIKKQLLKVGHTGGVSIGKKRIRQLLLFFIGNILLIIFLTAAEFFFHPAPLGENFNIIDLGMLIYLGVFIFFAYIFPKRNKDANLKTPAGSLIKKRRRKRSFVYFFFEGINRKIPPELRRNLFYFFFFLLLSPLIMAGELWAEINKRFRPGKCANPMKVLSQHIFVRAWRIFFRSVVPGIQEKNYGSFISINRLFYDIPYIGLMFMGFVVALVFVLLKLGDNPATPGIDGWIFQSLGKLTAAVLNVSDNLPVILFGFILLTVFATEIVSNTTVILVMFSLISTISPNLGVSPLFLMLAITISSTAAFMTPIASPVNAISYAGLTGVSLKRMLLTGFFMNLACTLWLGSVFYTLNILFG